MALFVRKFNKMFKKSGFFNKNKDKDKIKTKRTSKRPCFGCGKEGHFITECPNIKVRRRDTNKFDKNKKKEVSEAHLGEEWDSNDDISDSDIEAGLATISIGEPINKSSLFEDLTDDEDDFTHTCLMARGSKKEIARLSNSLLDEKKKEPKRGEFENHTKGFGSSYMNKFGFVDGKGLGKREQSTKDPIPFIKNHHTKGMGTRNVVHRMKQLGVKNHDNQVRYNTPIKFKSTQATTQAPQSKPNMLSKKPKPHASQDGFYADYVLTWNHKGKVVAKYVGPRTKGTLIKRNVWVPKILVTNTLGSKSTWVPKTQA
jgi:hypothetical protein